MGIKITNMKNFNFPSLLKRSAASLIAYSLTFQLAFSPFARLTATANSPEPSASIFEQAAEIIERKQAYVNSDPFLTRDQTVEIYDRKGNLIETIHFDQLSLKRVRPAITLSKARIEVESGDLLIEGFRGADEAGDGGFLIARHRISNLNLATENIDSSGDHELLMMVTKRGDLRAIDWGYVTLHAFETPILVHTLYNTLKANSQAELQNVRAEFWTPGRKPFSENDLVQDAVVPRDPATGKIFIEGGDLVVRSAEGDPNGSFVVGVYSRRVTHQKIAQDNIIISMMSDILSGNTQIIKDLDQLFRENESQYEKIMTDLNQIQNDSESDPKISFLIQSLPSHAIDTIRNRAKTNKRAGDRVVEKDSLKGWAEVYQNIKEKLTQKNNKSLVPLSDEAIARRWQEAFGPKPVDNNENLGFDFNKWTAVAIGSYMLAGAGLGYVESIEQVKILGWIYTHAFPDVLKDASYRWPLLVSSFYLTMLWPTAVGISMLSGKILDGLNSVTRNSHSKFAQFIRDLSASWGKMSNWTRITTMSLRIYPEFILGFWITAIERLGRQKTFFSAINNNINPFKIIEPSSEIGSKLKLNRPMRAGFINPFLNRDRFNEELKQKDAILSELKIQADKKLSRAWMLAASAVGAKYGIDLGTLLILQGKKDIRIADLEDLIKNPKACQEWEILTDDLYRSEMELFPFSSDEREIEDLIPPEKVAEQFLLIEKMADRIVQLDPKRKLLKKIFSKARTRFWLFKLWLANLGRKEYQFLKVHQMSNWGSNQIRREFVSDHLLSVALPAVVGWRANLSDPSALAADPNGFLSTSAAHWTDINKNVLVHLIFAGARLALVTETLKSKEESTYSPREDFAYRSTANPEKFFPGIWRFVQDTLNPMRGDIGGYVMNVWRAQLNTLQASLLLPLSMRLLPPASQPVEQAMMAVAMVWFLQLYWFYLPNLAVTAGSLSAEREISRLNDELVGVRRKLGLSLREVNPAKSKELREEGLTGLIEIYEREKSSDLPKIKELISQSERNIEEILALSSQRPPLPTEPNHSVLEFLPYVAGLVNVYLAVMLMTLAYKPEYLTLDNLGYSVAISTGLTAGFFAFLRADSWRFYLNPRPALEKIQKLFRPQLSCKNIVKKSEREE